MMVDAVGEAVWGGPDVAAVAGLTGSIAGVRFPAVVAAAEGAGVVGAGLARWTRS